ncbi:MAG: type II secretion system F family protein, partial [Planctomycetia bacterium]
MANSFQYTARGKGGAEVRGVIAASSAADAIRLLRGQALFPLKVQPAVAAPWRPFGEPTVPARVLAKFYSQMGDLLKAGVPLVRTLEILTRQSSSPRLSTILADVRQRVTDGSTIGDAMAVHENVFGELPVNMVRAGQEGGFLEDVFKRVGVFTERQEDLKGRVVGALAYPVLLGLIGSMVLVLLVVFAVPKFARIFDRLRDRGELPVATQVLLETSQFLQTYGVLVVAAGVGGAVWLRRYAATPNGRRMIDTLKLKTPVFGPVFRDLAITRFNRVLGTLRK